MLVAPRIVVTGAETGRSGSGEVAIVTSAQVGGSIIGSIGTGVFRTFASSSSVTFIQAVSSIGS